MRSLRYFTRVLLLVFACLGGVASTPDRADAQYRRWYGWHAYPYYWNGGVANPYRAYSPYSNWYGNYGGYYGHYPYYTWSRAYPWGWYW